MIAPNKGVEYSGSVDQYKLIAGFHMIPVRNNSPRNCFISCGPVGCHEFAQDLLDISSPDINCSAKRFVSVTK